MREAEYLFDPVRNLHRLGTERSSAAVLRLVHLVYWVHGGNVKGVWVRDSMPNTNQVVRVR